MLKKLAMQRSSLKQLIVLVILVGLLHPANTDSQPLETNAQALHPLRNAQSSTAYGQSALQSTSKPSIQFNSAIGSKNSQKIDPFAEQNAKAEAKKTKAAKTRKRFLLISIPILLVAIGGAITCAILWQPKSTEPESTLPVISDNSVEETTKVLQYLQNYENTLETEDSDEKREAINAVTEEILQHGNNSQYVEQVNLAVIMFDVVNGYYHELIKISTKIDVTNLPLDQKIIFYNSLAVAYQALGDNLKSEEYFNLTNEASLELVGPGEFNEN